MPVDVVIGAVAIEVPPVVLQSALNATSVDLHATCIYTHESTIASRVGRMFQGTEYPSDMTVLERRLLLGAVCWFRRGA